MLRCICSPASMDSTKLKEKAAEETEVLITELDFEKEYFLPLLGELFGVDVKNTNNSAGSRADVNDNTDTAGTPPGGEASTGTSPAPSITIDSQVITPETDPKLWGILAREAASEFSRYQPDPGFQRVMIQNPKFQWDVSTRLQEKFIEMEKQLAEKSKAITVLEGKDVKPKKGRKRKEKEMSAT